MVTPSSFEEQMNSLVAHNIESYTLGDFRKIEAGGKKYCLITFDDGHKSNLEAARILAKLGLTGYFYLVKDFSLQREDYLNEEDIKEIAALGHEFGVHGKVHAPWTNIPNDRLVSELKETKEWIEKLTRKKVITCSAPGGFVDRRVIDCIRMELPELKYIRTSRYDINKYEDTIINSIGVRNDYSVEQVLKIAEGDLFETRKLKLFWHTKDAAKLVKNDLTQKTNILMDKDKLLSETINVLRFPLAVGIVFIHNQMDSIQIQGGGYNYSLIPAVQWSVNLFSQVLPRIGVPLFFLFSGYLFFRSGIFSKDVYKEKLQRRSRSLLVPYLFWNFVGFLILLTQLHPLFIRFFPLYENAHIDISTFLSCFWGFSLIDASGADSPIDGPLWYVRDLMILCLTTPIIHWCIKKMKWPFIVVLGAIWFFTLGSYIGLPHMCHQGVFFFPLGAYFAINKKNFVEWVRTNKITKCLAYIAPVLLIADLIVYPKFTWLHQCWILTGMVCALYFVSLLTEKGKLKENKFLTDANFFVFCLHYLLINKFMKMCVMFLHPTSSVSILVLYFGIPVVIIFFCLGIFKLLNKYTPSFLKVINGGR